MEHPIELFGNIILVVLCVLALTAAMRYGFRDRAINALQALPDEKKERLISSYSRLISAYKLSLQFLPIVAIVLLVAGRVLQERALTLLAINNAVILVVIGEDYLFRKAVVDRLRRTTG